MIHMLVVSTGIFLDLVQTSSGKCSVSLKRRVCFRFRRNSSAGHSLVSRCVSWDVVSPLLSYSVCSIKLA